jgi:hypothetical protein
MRAEPADAAYVRNAIKDGYTHAVTNDRLDGRREAVSLHRSYEGAAKALIDGKRGNTIYVLSELAKR